MKSLKKSIELLRLFSCARIVFTYNDCLIAHLYLYILEQTSVAKFQAVIQNFLGLQDLGSKLLNLLMYFRKEE